MWLIVRIFGWSLFFGFVGAIISTIIWQGGRYELHNSLGAAGAIVGAIAGSTREIVACLTRERLSQS